MKPIIGFALSLALMVFSLFCMLNVSGINTFQARLAFALAAVWGIYGMLRSLLVRRARRKRVAASGAEVEPLFVKMPNATVAALRTFFNPADMRWLTAGALLLLLFVAVDALGTAQAYFFWILLVLLVVMYAVAFADYRRQLAPVRGKNLFFLIDDSGVSAVRMPAGHDGKADTQQGDQQSLIFTTRWDEITAAFFFAHYVRLATRDAQRPCLCLFARGEQMERLRSAVAARFGRKAEKAAK